MKLSSLRYYIAVAKYGDFVKESDWLFISQPTLSRTIQELEEELETQLFIRERRFLKLTEDGVWLLNGKPCSRNYTGGSKEGRHRGVCHRQKRLPKPD